MLHDRDTEGLLNWCLTEHLFFLQWHLVSFPHKHGGGTYCDKCWPMENRHPVPKGWLCAVGTEDCLMLKHHSHWLRTDSMLKCLAFWQLGESQTLHKKSGNVCVPDLNLLRWNMKSSHNWTRTCIFSFHNQWCMWVEFLSALECEVLLWAVCSVSPCLTRSVCSDSFVVGWRLLVQQCWHMIYLLTCIFLLYLKLNYENGW